MATISSLGLGSGLDSEGIVTKLVALEKQPLKALETKAAFVQQQISAMGQIQSQFSSLADAAAAMAQAPAWTGRNASSSNPKAAEITVTSSAAATSFTLDVDQLASSQSIASAQIDSGTAVGAGTLLLRLGTWSSGPTTFSPKVGSADISIDVTAADTVASVAAKINALNSGVVATAFNDGTKDRLLLRSKDTGAAGGFRLQASVDADSVTNDDSGVSRLAFDPEAGSFGMAGPSAGTVQYGSDAKARINGLAVTSTTNSLTGNIPGVTINLLSTTTTNYGQLGETLSPATLNVSEDVTLAVKNVQSFVTAYNTLAKSLSEITKYDEATKTASLFQGDTMVLGMQSVLRSIASSVSSGGAYQRLADVGLTRQLDGTFSMDTAKLAAAANNGTELQKLFVTNNSNAATNGFALKFRDFAQGVLKTGGAVKNKNTALDTVLKRNQSDQDRITARADAFETRLRKQYSSLDAKMAGLSALNAYVTQQVATWNKSTG
jgi:flagellar hook-associated protein 2